MSTSHFLSAFETCHRKGIWASQWDRVTLDGIGMLQAAVSVGLMETERFDFGECAGEEVMSLAADRGLSTNTDQVYTSVVHHACLADLLTTAVRTPTGRPWTRPEPIAGPGGYPWVSQAFLDPSGTLLRRLVMVSSWSDERHYSEIRSWHSLGEVAAYRLPMQQAVLVIGVQRDGRRHSPWTKGLLHPHNRQLRFKKKNGSTTGTFKDTWDRVWREDHAEIDRMAWLQGMLDDDVLRDVCFTVDIDVPGESEVQRIRDMAARKLDQLSKIGPLPDPQLSTCDWPHPCVFREECHSGGEPKQGRFIAAPPFPPRSLLSLNTVSPP